MRFFDRFLALIDAFAPASGPPPRELAGFVRWSLKGSEKGVALGALAAMTLGFSELLAAYFTGWAIDHAQSVGPGNTAALWPLFVVAAVFFLVIRPVLFFADSSIATVLLGPHLFPLVLSRLNRHTLGHSLRFFENDFAGRLSQKAIQTARGLSEIVVEVVDVVVYIAAMFIGALVLLAWIDGRMLIIFAVWFVAWMILLRVMIPRIQ